MTETYLEKLRQDYESIKRKVERGMLPLVARNPAIDRATKDYALAQAEHYHAEQAVGKNPPIPFRDANMLDKFADLALYEELKWSHPDKMTIVDYPIMSDTQAQARRDKYSLKSELKFGDLRYKGKRKSCADNSHKRVIDAEDPTIEAAEANIDLYNALDNAGLTDRQRQVIGLIYFENLTQEEAAAELGISRRTLREHLDDGLRKLRVYLTK